MPWLVISTKYNTALTATNCYGHKLDQQCKHRVAQNKLYSLGLPQHDVHNAFEELLELEMAVANSHFTSLKVT
jgi:hypothetical protein